MIGMRCQWPRPDASTDPLEHQPDTLGEAHKDTDEEQDADEHMDMARGEEKALTRGALPWRG